MADQIQGTIGTQSDSGASGAAKPASPNELSPNKLGEDRLVHDGNTVLKYSADDPPSLKAVYPPCINPSCKSYNRSHPNCLCYSALGESAQQYADGGQVCDGMHQAGCEHYEHPQETIDGAAAHQGLLHLLTKTGKTKSEDPMRAMQDHKEASIRGKKSNSSHMENMFEKGHKIKSERAAQPLKEQLEKFQLDPESMLDIGGNLDPAHSAQVAALAGNAVNYFSGMKPTQNKNNPLDKDSPLDRMQEHKYNRQLELAENPSSILSNIKDGTLKPADIQTLSTLYPKLYDSMKSKANESLITAITNKKQIPYKQRQSLSLFLGMPLDTTQTPEAMQAIISSQATQQAQNQAKNQPKKASGVELKQINKVNDMDMLPSQRRELNKGK